MEVSYFFWQYLLLLEQPEEAGKKDFVPRLEDKISKSAPIQIKL